VATQPAALDVLIIEDSETDAKLVVKELRASGFSPTWERVERTEALREALLRKTWHVLISDSSVPRLGTLEALAVAKELAPEVPFIVVSGTITEELAVQAMRAGAADYVTKDRLERLGAVTRELADATRGATLARRRLEAEDAERRRIAGELHDKIGRLLTALKLALDALSTRRSSARSRAKALSEARSLVDEAMAKTRAFAVEHLAVGETPRLTPRQRQVLELVVEGHSTKEIARRLRISVKTVETHRAEIMERLDIHNVVSLVHYAIRAGIVAPRG
jgi:DNA-binding NarL/FixJ family response regulator